MSFKRPVHAGAAAAACVALSALAAAPGAGATTLPKALAAEVPGKPLANCIRFDLDDQLVCGVLRQGKRGRQGPRGFRGYRGFTGPQGVQGVQGVQGPVGPQGPQGVAGPQGKSAAPGGTVVVDGSPEIFPAAQNGNEGQQLPPAIAECPASLETQAYGGGAIINVTGQHSGGDVVTLQSSYPGLLDGNQVDPITSSSPGPANAWQANAVVTTLAGGDTATITAYVVCGPGTT